ncbi:DUF3885 domain-containing protein [Dactylosporangium fulvum]|uniref:DUF3885 domain-containing protein n=1 Tax=Dactylosporangium fulvum TaxID=53359 RepID=A0ABY5VTJ5_9ACTN|nr:hypothetical protein [Dactylosporangium fulvum]UWP80436.1 hypothetical protein Dfulv_35485 [Dactylosporangium fulvum]
MLQEDDVRQDGPIDPHLATETWNSRWPECRPIAHELKIAYTNRWIRFHSLPQSKRYPDTEPEYAVVLHRHNTVLDELDVRGSLLVITADWTDVAGVSFDPRQTRARLAADGVHWQTILEDPDDDPEYPAYTQLYISTRPWKTGIADDILRAVADDELGGVILAPSDLRWLYHPYDGGADVILPTPAERDTLKERHQTWLSTHPSGL